MQDITDNYIAIFSTLGERILNTRNKQGFYDLDSGPYIFDSIDAIGELGEMMKAGSVRIIIPDRKGTGR